MGLSIDVIKNGSKGQPESFSRDKLHASIVAVCLGVYTPEAQAEATAHTVCDAVIIWLQQHPEVTNHDIRTITAKHLKKYHPEAAYLYEQRYIII